MAEGVCIACGSESDTFQQALMQRKLAYLQYARDQNRKAKAKSAAAILSYFNDSSSQYAPWPPEGWDSALMGVETELGALERLENDTDMGLQSWLRFLYLGANNPQVPNAAVARIELALTRYRYWIDEPIKSDQQFWSENHQIMYATAEVLAGQLLPSATFLDGLNGEQHRAKALQRADTWLSWRLYHGFNEWNSVYYEYTFVALMNLADFSDDSRIATRASMALDLLIFDLARFTQNGAFGATSGRAYGENKHSGWRQGIGDLVEMLFGTRGPWPGASAADLWVGTGSPGALALATTRKYCVPSVLMSIGQDRPERFIDRSRVSVNMGEPRAPGFATDEDGMFWWSKGAYFAGPMVDKSNEMIAKYQLGSVFDADWYNEIRNLSVPLLGHGNDLLSVFFEGMALTRANLYAYRDPDVMLSSVQGFRPGQVGPQMSPWQVTFDNEVVVFGSYPASLKGHDGPNWWTGNAVIPYVVQRDSAAIAVYSPSPVGAQALAFGHRTHLWFPFGDTDLSGTTWLPSNGMIDSGKFKFDEWVFNPKHWSNDLSGSMWIFGRRGDGYVGVYSVQPCAMVTTGTWAGKEISCDGLRNAFVIQVGNRAKYGSFKQFMDACVHARINVTDGIREPLRPGIDVEVSYDSPDPVSRQQPGSYRLELHYDDRQARFNGQPLATDEFPRFENPYAYVAWGAVDYQIAFNDLSLHHNQTQSIREGDGTELRPPTLFDPRTVSANYLYGVLANGDLMEYRDYITTNPHPADEPPVQRQNVIARAEGADVVPTPPIDRGAASAGLTGSLAHVNQAAAEASLSGQESMLVEPQANAVEVIGPPTIHQLTAIAVGNGWSEFRAVIPAGGGALYAVTQVGHVLWYRHDGILDINRSWTGPVDITPTWTGPVEVEYFFEGYTQVFGEGEGVVYGVNADGSLRWHKHLDSRNAKLPPNWAPAQIVGSGWRFTRVFGGGGGVIYAIRPDGTLLWYCHEGYNDGTSRWQQAVPVGNGWGSFKQVVSVGEGAIYALTPDNRLLYYKHLGWADGSPKWNAPVEIGQLGDVQLLIASIPPPIQLH